jgi:hypothetical protein
MPDNKYISLENLARFKSKLEQKIDEKQDNLGVNVVIPQGTTANELSSLKINESYYDLTKANNLEIGASLNFPVKLNRVFHIGKIDNDYLGITRTDEYSVTKELLAINKTAITSKTDLVVEKNLTVSQNITDGTNYIAVANIASKQDIAEAITDTIDQKLDKDNFGWVIADHTYNPEYSYNAGDTVYYVDETGAKRGFLYKAKEDIAAPAGDFDYTKWETITLERLIWYKQDKLTFDTAPTVGSENPVTSDGLSTALARKQGNLTFDATPTENSSNPVTSGGIYSAIQAASTPVPVYMHNITVQRQLNSPTS